jgi:hypothetical protein
MPECFGLGKDEVKQNTLFTQLHTEVRFVPFREKGIDRDTVLILQAAVLMK